MLYKSSSNFGNIALHFYKIRMIRNIPTLKIPYLLRIQCENYFWKILILFVIYSLFFFCFSKVHLWLLLKEMLSIIIVFLLSKGNNFYCFGCQVLSGRIMAKIVFGVAKQTLSSAFLRSSHCVVWLMCLSRLQGGMVSANLVSHSLYEQAACSLSQSFYKAPCKH